MSSRELNDLTVEFREQVEKLLAQCEGQEIQMRPFFTLRDPFDQAILWRQSRSIQEINDKIQELKSKGAHFLVNCLESVGSQSGRHVTNAIPGLSWHQWGEALDCFWLIDGKAEWSTTKKIEGRNGYKFYADAAEDLELVAGGHWRRFKDWPHVQLKNEGNPGKLFSLEEIDREMKARFG